MQGANQATNQALGPAANWWFFFFCFSVTQYWYTITNDIYPLKLNLHFFLLSRYREHCPGWNIHTLLPLQNSCSWVVRTQHSSVMQRFYVYACAWEKVLSCCRHTLATGVAHPRVGASCEAHLLLAPEDQEPERRVEWDGDGGGSWNCCQLIYATL